MNNIITNEDFAYVEEFYGPDTPSAATLIQKALNSDVPRIKFRNTTYQIETPLVMTKYHILEGVARDCGGGTIIKAASNFPLNSSMLTISYNAAELSYLSFVGGNESHCNAEKGIVVLPLEESGTNTYENTYNIRLHDISVSFCSEIGVDLSVFMCSLNRVTSRFCGIGFYIHGIEGVLGGNFVYSPGTSTLLSQCYARGCPYAGYEISNMNYSSLMCCAADDCGVLNPSTNLNGRSISNGYGYAYRFYGCHALDIISCGAEACYYTLFFTLCSNIKVDSFSEYNPNNRNWIISEPISMVQCSFMSFFNCNFEGKKDITLNTNETKKVIHVASGSNSYNEITHSVKIAFFNCSAELRKFDNNDWKTDTVELSSDFIMGGDSGNVDYY